MTLTIEITNPTEIAQLIHVFSTMNLENINVVMNKNVDKYGEEKADAATTLLKTLNRPIKKTLDIEAIKKAKNYKGLNRERFDKLVKEMNITEPIDLLIAQLSR